jgi:hypothetical protein
MAMIVFADDISVGVVQVVPLSSKTVLTVGV